MWMRLSRLNLLVPIRSLAKRYTPQGTLVEFCTIRPGAKIAFVQGPDAVCAVGVSGRSVRLAHATSEMTPAIWVYVYRLWLGTATRRPAVEAFVTGAAAHH
jgi:hypothetical protein